METKLREEIETVSNQMGVPKKEADKLKAINLQKEEDIIKLIK